jgi:transposase
MPPAYVKPYIKRQKNDAADAEAICEAVTRANMRFVETKTPEQQSCLECSIGRAISSSANRPR